MGAIQLGGLLFSLALWAVLFWGSIRVLEPGNGNNSFGKALAISSLYVLSVLAVQVMSLIGIFFAVAWLVFLLRLLISWYEMGILKSLGVVAAVNVTPYFLVPWLLQMAGGSLIVLFYGFPVAVIAVWLIAGKGVRMPTLPRARATKAPKEPRPAKAAKGDSAAKPAPIATPPRPVAIEPPPPPPPPGDKPRLLT